MSLLIKALKRAERRHDVVRQSAEALPPVPASIAATQASAPAADPTLTAVDAAEPELQLEVAQFQNAAAVEADSDPSSVGGLSADSAGVARHDTPVLAEAQQPLIESAPLVGSALLSNDPAPVLDPPPVPAQAAFKLSLEEPATTGARVLDKPLAARSVQSAGTANVPPASRTAAPEHRAVAEPFPAKPDAGMAKARAFKPTALQPRVLMFGTVGLFAVACVGWLLIEFLGVVPWQKQSPALLAPTPMATPGAASPSPPAVASESGNSPANSAARNAGKDSDNNRKSGEYVARTGGSAARNPTAVTRESGGTSGPASRRGAEMASGRDTRVPALGNAEAVAVRRSEPADLKSASVAVLPATAPSTATGPLPATGMPAGIRLSRDDTSAQQILQLNDRAWTALSRNDLNSARQSYEASLKLDRNNIDAWLGLASLAARAGDVANAEHHYRRALDIEPNDSAARAGLLALTAQQEPRTAESRLRGLIDREGAQPPMMFALGNTLAAQQRWADAQAAYFAAYSGDPANADYAFNLAISLEHIRQPVMAANYYRKSLELAIRRPGRFDRAHAERRLAALTAAADLSSKAEQPQVTAAAAESARE